MKPVFGQARAASSSVIKEHPGGSGVGEQFGRIREVTGCRLTSTPFCEKFLKVVTDVAPGYRGAMNREEIAVSIARHVAGAHDGSTFIVLVLNPDGSASSSISTVSGGAGEPMHGIYIAGAAHLELSSLIETACRPHSDEDGDQVDEEES